MHYRWYQENNLKVIPFSWIDFVLFNEFENWIFHTSITDYMKYSNITKYDIIKFENLEHDINNIIGQSVIIGDPYHGCHDIKKWYTDVDFVEYVNKK